MYNNKIRFILYYKKSVGMNLFTYMHTHTHICRHQVSTEINRTFDAIFIGSLILKNDHDIS